MYDIKVWDFHKAIQLKQDQVSSVAQNILEYKSVTILQLENIRPNPLTEGVETEEYIDSLYIPTHLPVTRLY